MYKVYVNNVIIFETSNEDVLKIFKNSKFDQAKLAFTKDGQSVLLELNNLKINEELKLLESKLLDNIEVYVSLNVEDYFIQNNVDLDELESNFRVKFGEKKINNQHVQSEKTKKYFQKMKKKNMSMYTLPIFTYTIITLCIVLFLSQNLGLIAIPPEFVLHGKSAINPISLKLLIQIVVSSFMHGSLIHLIFNMLFLYSMGTFLERYIGTLKLAFVYIVTMLVSGFIVYIFSGPLVFTVGASGALFGLLSFTIAYMGIKLKSFRHLSGIISVLVFNIIFTFTISGISILGHLSGMVCGFFLALIVIYLEDNFN